MPKGDHIYVRRGFYAHHGIEFERGKVIHYAGELGKPGKILVSSMTDFLRGGRKQLYVYGKCLPVKQTVDMAFSRLGEDAYDFLTNNCEHFARWCKTGEAVSRQVEVGTKLIGTIIEGLVLVTMGAVFMRGSREPKEPAVPELYVRKNAAWRGKGSFGSAPFGPQGNRRS